MRALAGLTAAQAAALAARVDAALGYPRTPTDADRRGDGVHAPLAQARTLRHADALQHPSRAEWAYPVDAVVEARLTDAERARVAELVADWTPATAPERR